MSSSSLALPGLVDDFAPLHEVTVTLVAELDRTRLPFTDVAGWTEGSLVALPSSAGETISIYVGDVRIGSGEVLVVDGVLTVRVSDLVGAPAVPDAAGD
jgi:flagellar motor switch/type III secretory pathway protein FliN